MGILEDGLRNAFAREGLDLERFRLPDLLSMSKSAVHRLAYSGLYYEVLRDISSLERLAGERPATLTGQVLCDMAHDMRPPKDMEEGWLWSDRFFGKDLPEAMGHPNSTVSQVNAYLDYFVESNPDIQGAISSLRALFILWPSHPYVPGGPNAQLVEQLDHFSIWAWYTRMLTNPLTIDDGEPDMKSVSEGYVYFLEKSTIPELSIDEMRHATEAMLQEASVMRQGSIPNAAFVEINSPPFVALCFAEITPNLVLMEALDASGRALPVTFFPASQHASVPNTGAGPDGKMDSFDKITQVIALIGASALRDFWVIEDRDRILGPPRFSRVRGLKKSPKRVIYLPRVKYITSSALKPGSLDPMKASERRAHWRSAHYRKLPEGHTPSRRQMLLAKVNEMIPPEGCTWVRGTTVAGTDVEVVYRSRSAVQALFDSTPVQVQTHRGLSWFSFERGCARWLRSRHFEELSRQGTDRGVDIYCVKGSGDDAEFWVIQCKHTRAKVGPEKVRELHGARALREADRAMLITSSAFTPGAIETARDLGIDLVDGGEIDFQSDK